MNKENSILETISKLDYKKGEEYPSSYIKFVRKENKNRDDYYYFNVKSERLIREYKVTITTYENVIIQLDCTCPQFFNTCSCKHIAASLLKYEYEIFDFTSQNALQKISHDILNNLVPDESYQGQKTQLNLEVELYFYNTRYHIEGFGVRLKVGAERLYIVGNKMSDFLDLFCNNGDTLYFGKQFTYNPNTQFFSKEDEQILSFLYETIGYIDRYGSDLYLERERAVRFLEMLKYKRFKVLGEGTFSGILEENPFESILQKEGDIYTYKIKKMETVFPLTTHYEYIVKDESVYHLPKKIAQLIEALATRHMDSLIFNESDLPKFAKGVLPSCKENTKMDASLEKKLTIIEPVPQLYLDIKNDVLTCDLYFLYGEDQVSYFGTRDNSYLRNDSFENTIVESLLQFSFTLQNKCFEISEIDAIADFLEDSMEELSQSYQVYTTSILKNTTILRQTNVTSQFSIGKDNIMKFSFELDGMNSNELSHIFQSMKQKKRYYKLKSGDVLDIEHNKGLAELRELTEEMDISASMLNEGTGILPKYRAIYLDSLQQNKYSIIQTDSLFKRFIENFKTYQKTDIMVSLEDQKKLRDYQILGVKWLYNIYKCELGGILADEMGLGKSIQVICFIKQILKEKKNAKILIASPTSLIYNWENEFDKFGKELNYKVIAEGKEARKEAFADANTNIFITTYGLVRNDKELYENTEFEVLVLDEAQAIKNPGSSITKLVKKINAHTKIALTGTPLENSVMELWSIFDFIMPGYLTGITKFQKIYNKKEVDPSGKDVLRLNAQISPFILRRKKKDVAKELPDKIENNIFIELGDMQKAVYVGELKKTQKEMDEIIKSDGLHSAQFKILQLLMKLRQICIDPRIVYDNYKGGSAKIKELIPLVKGIIKNNHKILIFTSFKTALEIAEKEFQKHYIKTCRIDGSVPSKKRKELVDTFNEDDTNVFLIMLKSGGTGLNLTGADIVIHLDLWWNPQVENQATDRAHRIGQTKNVEVIKLICKGTIEERILELQNKKKILSDTFIEGNSRDKNTLAKLSEKDIKKLLSYDEN